MIIALTLFIFALIIGICVIGRVPATLHTPLMSGANSIHGVVLVGVIIVAALNSGNGPVGYILIFLAALLGSMNVVGGYVVTDRMLEMFKAKKPVLETEIDPEQLEDNGSFTIEITEQVKADASVAESVAAAPEIIADQSPEASTETSIEISTDVPVNTPESTETAEGVKND